MLEEPVASHETPEPRHNLQQQTTPFIGRESELAQLNQLMANDDIRLLTILASGGMGKTRLALELAHQQLTHYPDGVYFIPLAPLDSASQLIATIANELELHIQEDRELYEQLLGYLSTKHMLLILDNFEHLLDAAPLVNKLVQVAPSTRLIITSREKLALTTEKVFHIDGMTFPALDAIGDVFEYDTVRLFLKSAGLDEDDVDLDTTALVRICRLTGGMPLAILLAAGWVDTLSLTEIADEIQQGIDFLAAEMQDLAPRHRSIVSVFDPTWKRLTEDEKSVFMKFAVFRGGCTREAAQSVTGATLGQLRVFVNKALLSRTPDNRYVMHELLRQYAKQHLKAAGKDESTYDTHQRYFLNFLREQEANIKGNRQLDGLAEIHSDFANVRSAWYRAADQQDYAGIDQSLECLLWFLIFRNRYQEGITLLYAAAESLAKSTDAAARQVWARISVRQTLLATFGFVKQPANRRGLVEEILVMQNEYQDQKEIGVCMLTLGYIAWRSLDDPATVNFSKQSLACFREVHDRFYMVRALYLVGQATGIGKWSRQGLQVAREIGDRFGMAQCLYTLGAISALEGDGVLAMRNYQETLQIQREIGDLANYAVTCAVIAHNQSSINIEAARAYAEESLAVAKKINHPNGEGYALIVLGLLAAFEENYTLCKQLCLAGRKLSQNHFRNAVADWGLSISECGLGNYQTAVRYLPSQLENRLRYIHSLALGPATLILAHTGEPVRAVELLSFQAVIPGNRLAKALPIIIRLHDELKEVLDKAVYNAAWERGKSLDLETVVQELLMEFRP